MGRSRALTIALGLSLGPAIALGFARFAYALVLPAMRIDLGWNYAVAGSLNTANALGYLAGAVLADPLARRVGTRSSFVGSLIVTAVALAAMAPMHTVGALVTLRFLAGLSGAVVFVAGATMATHLAATSGPGGTLLVGVYIGGVGIGIVLSGAVLPFLVPIAHPSDWPLAWWGMAFASAVLAVFASVAAGRVPEPPRGGGTRSSLAGLGALTFAMAVYLLFGLGYISYMTFLVAFIQESGRGAVSVAFAWSVLGLSAAVHGFVWQWVFRRIRLSRALALAVTLLAVGAALPLASHGDALILLSGVLFGVSFLAVVSAVTLFVQQSLPPERWRAVIGFATVLFALGQSFGPLVTGALADLAGGLDTGLAVSAATLVFAIPLALLQRDPSRIATRA